MAGTLRIYGLGNTGVNVDADPLELQDTDLRQAQNTIRDPLGIDSGLRKRPGLVGMNASSLNGSILGGVAVLDSNLMASGDPVIYLGRGPIS